MRLILRAVTVTNLGLVRTNNEDSAYAGRRLLAVADGVGGQPAGEVASEIVIRALAPLDDALAGDEPGERLRAAVETANQEIRASSGPGQGHEGMATTVTAVLVAGERAALLHVGDSRCYRYRDGALSKLTRDDTFVQSLVDEGVLTAEEARGHPLRSVVTQAVQGGEFTPTVTAIGVTPGDRFLLCSDGLSDVVTDDAIARALDSRSDPRECADHLVELALDAGGPDNVTVVVGDVVEG